MEADTVGLKRLDQSSLCHTAPKLVLLAVAPSINVPILVEREYVVRSARQLGDLCDTVDVNGRSCGMAISLKAKDTFVFLQVR